MAGLQHGSNRLGLVGVLLFLQESLAFHARGGDLGSAGVLQSLNFA
jgi:hypothetical protein